MMEVHHMHFFFKVLDSREKAEKNITALEDLGLLRQILTSVNI